MVNKKILMCAVAACTLSANHIYADETHVSMRDLLCPQTYIASVTTLPPVKQYNVLEDTESGIIVHTETRMYTTTAVNLRTKNTTKSKSVKLLKAGKAITVLDKSHHKWQKIFYKGKIRYINSKYLSKKKPVYTSVRSVTLHGLSEQQKQRAYTMAEICIKEWKKYGVLPSVCIAQAMQESTLGKYCSPNNLWQIKSGAVSYGSLEEGVYAYLKVINNGCYKGAPFAKDPLYQIERILAGGYCIPVGNYYSCVNQIINKYDLRRFDKLIEG